MTRSLLAVAGTLLFSAAASAQSPAPALAGSVHGVDDGDMAGVRLLASCGEATDTSVLDGSGRFSLSLECGSQKPRLVFSDPLNRYLPSEPTNRDSVFLLIPRFWRIAGGTYGGTDVPVDLRGATTPGCSMPTCSAFFSREDTARGRRPGIPVWMSHSLPLRVALSPEGGAVLNARDSAAFMSIAEALENDLGRKWFQPAQYDDVFDAPAGSQQGAIIVTIDPGLASIGRGIWASQRGEIVAGVIYLQSARFVRQAASLGVVVHEIMHTLGFGHTCSWRSVMAGEQCMRLRARSPTPPDVAHAQLLLRLRDLELRYGLHGTISATLAAM